MREKRSIPLGIRTTPAIKSGLDALAQQEDRTVSDVVNRILAKHLKKSGKSTAA